LDYGVRKNSPLNPGIDEPGSAGEAELAQWAGAGDDHPGSMRRARSASGHRPLGIVHGGVLRLF
jgi:hypothetical protein